MASISAIADHRKIRRRMRNFMTNGRSAPRQSLINRLSRLREASYATWTFGGFPRDLTIRNRAPRDIDIVVFGASPEEAIERVGGTILRKTRFGGVHADVGGWPIDIWEAERTWAFQAGLVTFQSVEDLPKTTFLNIESIAVEMFPQLGQPRRRVVESGFFDAIKRQTIELNLEHNPYPELCVVRSLVFANRLRYSIGPRLVSYLATHLRRIDSRLLYEVQIRHYGRVLIDYECLQTWRDGIYRHAEERPLLPLQFSRVQSDDR